MTRATASSICAGFGVLLLIFAGVAPAEWHAAVALFVGLALLAVSHVQPAGPGAKRPRSFARMAV
jgi:hypothetical protein